MSQVVQCDPVGVHGKQLLLPTGVYEVDAVLQAAGHLEDVLFGRLHADADPSLHHIQLQRRRGDFGVPARAEPWGEGPGRPGGGGGGGGGAGLHSGVVPLPGDRGDVAEVTAQPLDALTGRHVRPVRLSVDLPLDVEAQ